MSELPSDLSKAQRRELAELAEIAERGYGSAYWQPATPGEWAVARALERRGLLLRNASRGGQAYEFRLSMLAPSPSGVDEEQ